MVISSSSCCTEHTSSNSIRLRKVSLIVNLDHFVTEICIDSVTRDDLVLKAKYIVNNRKRDAKKEDM